MLGTKRAADPDIVAIKRRTNEDMVTYLRVKYAESDSEKKKERKLLKVKERTY